MFSAGALMDAAKAETGLDDFGDDYFREGLEKLLAAAATEVRLNERGQATLRARAITYLSNRLQIEHWYRLHPEIDDEEIVAPVFGLGLPRTGSTVLQCLMAEDPAVRSLRTWESEQPCPPPDAATQANDPRIAAMEAAQAGFSELARLAPEILTMLPLQTVRDPTECQDLHGLSFRSHGFLAVILFKYLEWLASCDMEPSFRYHKRALKLLQWRCPPKRWRLKSPVNMFNLPALDAVYPDARFVVTHRDVVDSVPSMAALAGAMSRMYADDLDYPRIGAGIARRWHGALDRMDAFRDTQPAQRFYDIGFRRAQTEPMAAVREMYDWLGEPFTAVYEARMEAWRVVHSKDKNVRAKPNLAQYGLEPETLRNMYKRYMDRYRAYIAA
jgi:hypothetical protein